MQEIYIVVHHAVARLAIGVLLPLIGFVVVALVGFVVVVARLAIVAVLPVIVVLLPPAPVVEPALEELGNSPSADGECPCLHQKLVPLPSTSHCRSSLLPYLQVVGLARRAVRSEVCIEEGLAGQEVELAVVP